MVSIYLRSGSEQLKTSHIDRHHRHAMKKKEMNYSDH